MRVTVVIPARNDAVLLERCLEALAQQRRRPDEIVVVDNGSADDTAEVARAAGARVVPQPIVGIPRAAATGYDAARGDLIARVDADSICPPAWLARVVEHFERDPDLAFLTGTGRFYGASRGIHALGERLYLGGMYWAVTPYLGHPPLFGSNFAMRRAAWVELSDEVHRDRRDIHDDLDLSFHVKPWMRVRYARDITVEVSARPFETLGGMLRRLSWVLPTLRAHWPEDAPWRRRAARRRWRRDQAAARA